MLDFFQEAISPLNLPFTILLGLMILYWLVVIMGAADADWMPDLDLDADDGGGLLASFFQFLSLGDVPVTVVVSVMIFSAWCFSMLANHFLNPGGSIFIGTTLLFINMLLGLFATALFTRVMLRIFGPLHGEDTEDQQILYRVGTVITSRVDADFGQVEIETKGAPITVNARAVDDRIFTKGEKVLIFDEDEEKGIFFVDKYEA
ncbi:DUF1449 domain-containing protein [Desulfonema ishimotonii]|uniref:DUF1449 domain-containing protein n=1 Tax=Desulfonema ishimotonii TaxID=45657 RepID=A0A401G3W1_9BACT|nr:hypothetical protein [Desulfonema ishimotonii]GBC63904.1 DUF1449 domain-containing protein [Desulfonema ishimotonii]